MSDMDYSSAQTDDLYSCQQGNSKYSCNLQAPDQDSIDNEDSCIAYAQNLATSNYKNYDSFSPSSSAYTFNSGRYTWSTESEQACVAYAEQEFSNVYTEYNKTDESEYSNGVYDENIYAYIEEYEKIDDEESLDQIYVTIDEENDERKVIQRQSVPASCFSVILNPHQLLFGWKSKVPWACQTTLRTWSRVLSTKIGVQFSVAANGNTAAITFLRRTLKDYCRRAPNSIKTEELLPNGLLANIQTVFDMAKHKPTRFKYIIGINCFPIHMSMPRSLWKDLKLLNELTAANGKSRKSALVLVSTDAAADRLGQIQQIITSYYAKRYDLDDKALRTFVADTGPGFRSMHPSYFALKALSSLAQSGQSILLPEPFHPTLTIWFNVYQHTTGVEPRYYRRNPKRSWMLDFGDLQAKIDDTTAAVFFSNPAVMCGGISSLREMDILVGILAKRNIPLIVEENMDYLVYDPQQPSHSILELKPQIPIMVINSCYRWMVFGAQGPTLAWALTYDPNFGFPNRLFETLKALQGQTVKQSELPLPSKLSSVLYFDSWVNDIAKYLARNTSIASRMLSETPGLHVAAPKAGYFLIVLIDFADSFNGIFQNDKEFTTALFAEESVKVLCGSLLVGWKECFALEMYMRRDLLEEACDRIDDFCRRHTRNR